MKGAAQNRRAQRKASGLGLGRAMWAAVGVACVWALVGLVRTEASGGGGGSAEPAEPFRLTLEESGSHEMRLHWPGKAEHTYFLQSSEDLVDWVYEPAIFADEHYGPEHDRHEVQITPQSARGFFRAIRSEHYAADPWWADFDGDGIPNGIELLIGYDPLKADSLGDGVPDGQRDSHAIGIPDWWQLLHFGETGIDPNALSANGFYTHAECLELGLDPNETQLPREAVDWDPRATWDRAPESRYVVIGLSTPSNYQGGVDGIVDPYAPLDPDLSALTLKGAFGVAALGPDGRVLLNEDRRALISGIEQGAEAFRTWIIDPGSAAGWGSPLEWEAGAAGIGVGLGSGGAATGLGVLPLLVGNQPATGPSLAAAVWHIAPDGGTVTRVFDNAGQYSTGAFAEGHTGIQYPKLYGAGIADSGEHGFLAYDFSEDKWKLAYGGNYPAFDGGQLSETLAFLPFVARGGDMYVSSLENPSHSQLHLLSGDSLPGPTPVTATGLSLLHGVPDQYGILTSEALWLRQPDGSWEALRKNSTAVDEHKTGESAAQGGVGGLAINSRGEILRDTTTLWRNGKDYPIASLVLSPDWSDFHITQLNDSGMMAGFAVPDPGEGQGPGLAQVVVLMPVEVAPSVVRVNSGFLLGLSSPSLGYVLPDNEEPTLIAAQDHLDGLHQAGDIVTDNLVAGWFGIHPKRMPDSFFDESVITIEKIQVPNEEFGGNQRGEVTLYATWEDTEGKHYKAIEPYDRETGEGSNLVGIAYGSGSGIPADAEFWIEGLHGGLITLRFTLTNDGLSVIHEQEFLVATQQSRSDWEAEMEYQIRLQTALAGPGDGVLVSDYVKTNSFMSNRKYILPVYEYYAQLYGETAEGRLAYHWPGMAKLAGSPVYAGLSDAEQAKGIVFAGGVFWGALSYSMLNKIQMYLMQGNIDIFQDLAWQFHAHRYSGIYAIDYVDLVYPESDIIYDNGWVMIEEGIRMEIFEMMVEGNQNILEREQEEILRPTYEDLKTLPFFVETGFSKKAKNPIVIDGPTFKDVVPDSDIRVSSLFEFDDRWIWITHPEEGMIFLWLNSYDENSRLDEVRIPLRQRANNFTTLLPAVPVF